MHREKGNSRSAVALALTLLASAGATIPALADSPTEPKWGSHIDVEAKPGTDRSLGESDVFMPLRQDKRALLFLNIRARIDDDHGSEGNFGLGWRRMGENGRNVGVYRICKRQA